MGMTWVLLLRPDTVITELSFSSPSMCQEYQGQEELLGIHIVRESIVVGLNQHLSTMIYDDGGPTSIPIKFSSPGTANEN